MVGATVGIAAVTSQYAKGHSQQILVDFTTTWLLIFWHIAVVRLPLRPLPTLANRFEAELQNPLDLKTLF
jgi:hypothetical protein